MKQLFIRSAAIAILFIPYARAADIACEPFRIPAELELPAGKLVFADLFPPNTCPAILSTAQLIPLGNVPLPGSPRVFTQQEIRLTMERLGEQARPATKLMTLPERVTVRRQGEQEVTAGALSQKEPSRMTHPKAVPLASAEDRAVRAGQTVMLIWDQDGIRVQVPARCLDPGASGSQVRARILQSGMVVRATVVGARSLRISS